MGNIKGSTLRTQRLAENVMVTPMVCTQRLRLYTESYRATEGLSPLERQSKAFRHTLENMSIYIDDGELIVGCPCSKSRGSSIQPELNAQWLLKELDDLSVRQWDRFQAPSVQEKADIFGYLPWWNGKSAFEKWFTAIPEGTLEALGCGFFGGASFAQNGIFPGHMVVDFDNILKLGLRGLHEKAERLDSLQSGDEEKHGFYCAVLRCLEAVRDYSLRYSKLAAVMADGETAPQRRAELLELSRICKKVPWEPAESFHEALQAVYMLWVCLMIEGWGRGLSLGRMDQYLYRYYRRDIDSGGLNDHQATELIETLIIKVNSTVTVDDYQTALCFAGFPQAVNITVGGTGQDGRSAVNELSYLLMAAERSTGMTAEDLVIRVSAATEDRFLTEAVQLAKDLNGKLKFVSDPVALSQMKYDGYPDDMAWDYAVTGCNSPCICGVSLDYPGGLLNLPLLLELALNNGVARLSGRRIGPATGDARKFATYGELWEAFCRQAEYFIDKAVFLMNMDRKVIAENLPLALQSALMRYPLDNGRDVFSGGTGRFARQSFSLSGAPNVGDSLAAVKKTVFEDKTLTMSQILDALDADFVGYEMVLRRLNSTPKFGNDDEYVDSIVNAVLETCSDYARGYTAYCGTPVCVAAATISSNVPLGLAVGALPDGRRAKEPISEGGISPHQGRNLSGATATFNSVASLCHEKLTNGSVLNMRFDPKSLQSDASIAKFIQMLKVYLLGGGFFVQFNIVDGQQLRDAQLHPELHKDLLVRVATYSAYFVELSKDMQDDIIARVEFGSL